MKQRWAPIYLERHEKFEQINELSIGTIPALILKKAFSSNVCKRITKKILDFNSTSNGPGINMKIGESLNSFINNKHVYFQKTKLIDKKLEQHFIHEQDPRISMQNLLSFVFTKNIIVARENNFNYSNGVFRFHKPGESVSIHRDCAYFESNDYEISKHSLQFSAVLHLQPSEYGGELILFRKHWTKDDERFRLPNFGYSKDVVDNTESIKIKPEIGDIVIINPIQYHTISEIDGKSDRISVGFFFAPCDESTMVCWS